MNDESSSSSAKHVSFSDSVDVIEDSAFEYVELPPIIYESMNESDSVMSFTELTESSISDRYYETQQSLSELHVMDRENYNNFGEKSLTSMSFNELYDSYGPLRNSSGSIEEVPAVYVPTVYNHADLNTQSNDGNNVVDDNDDDDDDTDDHHAYPKPGPVSWLLGAWATLSSLMGVFGMCLNWFGDSKPVDTDDVVAITHVSAAGVFNKGFFIPSLLTDGGATYVT